MATNPPGEVSVENGHDRQTGDAKVKTLLGFPFIELQF
jgi:hypothetical protein